jgi:hypothetical protein
LPGTAVYVDLGDKGAQFRVEPATVSAADGSEVTLTSEKDGAELVVDSANPVTRQLHRHQWTTHRVVGFYLGARINPELPADKLTYIATLLAAALGSTRAMHKLSTRIVDDSQNTSAIDERDHVYVQQPDEYWSVKLYQEISDYLL